MRHCAALTLLSAALAGSPIAAQFGAIGLSSIGGQRFANEDLLFFDPQSGDQFARALAVGDFNGDGADDLAAGIPHDNGITGFEIDDCGAVVVRYGISGSGLESGLADALLNQVLGGSPDPAEEGDNFGAALAACDFNDDGFDDLAVGIPNEDRNADTPDSGAVEVYYGAPSGLATIASQLLTQETSGIPGVGEDNDLFGFSLACGDFDADGVADLAIGVPGETFENLSTDALAGGTVTVLLGGAGGLDASGAASIDQEVPGVDGDAEPWDRFGWALATGDFNGDSFADLAVGVPGEDGPGIGDGLGRGAVQVLLGGASGISTVDLLRTESGLGGTSEDGDQFGYALAAGDFDGDGFDDLAIGVPFEDFNIGPVSNGGQLIAIYGAAGGFNFGRNQLWFEDIIHGPGSTETGDQFGRSLAAGDFDGDGRDDLAIGEPGEFVLVPQDGMVTVIMGAASGLAAARRHGLAAGFHGNPGVQNQANRNYGFSIATGDFDGDGYSDLAIGAPNEDEGGRADVGACVVLYGSVFSDGFEVQNPGFWSGSLP